jgi:hypothetical protein
MIGLIGVSVGLSIVFPPFSIRAKPIWVVRPSPATRFNVLALIAPDDIRLSQDLKQFIDEIC